MDAAMAFYEKVKDIWFGHLDRAFTELPEGEEAKPKDHRTGGRSPPLRASYESTDCLWPYPNPNHKQILQSLVALGPALP